MPLARVELAENKSLSLSYLLVLHSPQLPGSNRISLLRAITKGELQGELLAGLILQPVKQMDPINILQNDVFIERWVSGLRVLAGCKAFVLSSRRR